MLKRVVETVRGLIGLLSSSRSMKNVIWNLIGGLWAGMLVVLATPWYVSRLGLEGYGILGIWLVMQVMMGLLDLGMGPSLVREFADPRQDHEGLARKRDLLRTLEIVQWAIAALLILALVSVAGWAGDHWLRSQTLSRDTIGNALRLMGIALALQFPCALYSNGLSGLQAHGRMNALQITGNTLRYGAGVAVLFWRADLVWFFAVQAVVAAIQTFATRSMLWGMISESAARPPVFHMKMLHGLWRFSVGMGLGSVASVLLANVDRIALSKMEPTVELGKYAVAFTATGLLQLGIQPFYRAFFPRYSELVSSGDTERLRSEYFLSCRLMAVAIIPLGFVGWAFAPDLLRDWLGKDDPTIIAVFRWLLIGITCSGLGWLPAAFQQAHGWARLHAVMIAGSLVFGAPFMIWAIRTFGTVGATTVWVVHGVSDLTVGMWLMHRRLLTGGLLEWYRTVVLRPVLVSVPVVALARWLTPHGLNRWVSLCLIGVISLIAVGVALLSNGGGAERAGRLAEQGAEI